MALAISTSAVVLFLNAFVVRLENLLEARYLVVLGGMLLGNCLSANIIGADRFYRALHHRQEQVEFYLGNGASLWEALRPFAQETLTAALRPIIASMMTMGLVSLPGMMTGQMLGGSPPLVAIKYQIAIMLAIFSCASISVSLFLFLTARRCIDGYGCLQTEDVFKSS